MNPLVFNRKYIYEVVLCVNVGQLMEVPASYASIMQIDRLKLDILLLLEFNLGLVQLSCVEKLEAACTVWVSACCFSPENRISLQAHDRGYDFV